MGAINSGASPGHPKQAGMASLVIIVAPLGYD
jgi:hypothetical protein